METLTVMMPYLPDDERAQRLNALRLGEIELSDAQREKLVLQAARGMMQAGKKPTVPKVKETGHKKTSVTMRSRRKS